MKMSLRSRQTVCLACILSAYAMGPAKFSWAQISVTSSKAIGLTSTEFSTQVRNQLMKPESNEAELNSLSGVLISRLRQERFTSDQSIIDLVTAWQRFETPFPPFASAGKPVEYPYLKTRELIASLLPFLRERPVLEGQMHQVIGSLDLMQSNWPDAQGEYQKATDLLGSASVDIGIRRMDSMLHLANAFRLTGRARLAEPIYVDTMSYSWWVTSDPDKVNAIVQIYVQAGFGLIETRRHNLELLKQIRFWGAVNDQLKESLHAAIMEAQREKDAVDVKLKASMDERGQAMGAHR